MKRTLFSILLLSLFATRVVGQGFPTITNFNAGSFIVDPRAANPTNVIIANIPFHGGAYDLPGNMIWWVSGNILNSRQGYVPYLAGPTNFANSPWNVLPAGPLAWTTNKIAFNDTNYFIQRIPPAIIIGTNTVDTTVQFDIPSWTGTGTRGLSDDGTYKVFGAGVGVINPTDNYVPYRIDATTFGDSPWYRMNTNKMGFAGYTNVWLEWKPDGVGLDRAVLGMGDGVFGLIDPNTTQFGAASVAIGTRAFGSAMDARASVALGWEAGNYATNIFDAVLIGYAVGGPDNIIDTTIVGASAGPGSGSITNDTYVGYSSGAQMTGSFNTTVGAWAGAGAIHPANSSTNQIAIGAYAAVTNNNDIVIGNTSNARLISPITSWTGTGSKVLTDDGTYHTASSVITGAISSQLLWTNSPTGAGTMTSSSNVIASLPTGLDGATLLTTEDVFAAGENAGQNMVSSQSTNLYNIGLLSGSGMAATNAWFVMNLGDGAGQTSIINDSQDIFNFGLVPGESATITNGSWVVMNIGDNSGYGMNLDQSQDIFNYGWLSGDSMGVSNSIAIFNYGDWAGKNPISVIQNSQDIFNYGNGAGGDQNPRNSTNLFNYGLYAGGSQNVQTVNSYYNYGTDSGYMNVGLASNSEELYNYGAWAGASLAALVADGTFVNFTNVYNYGPEAGMQIKGTNATYILNYGYRAGEQSTMTGVSDLYNYGSDSGYQSTYDTSATDIYNYGTSAGKGASYTNSFFILNSGNSAGQSMIAQDSSSILNLGSYAGADMIATNSSSIVNIGPYAGNLANLTNSTYVFSYGDRAGNLMVANNASADIFNYGHDAGKSMVADGSIDIYNFGVQAGQSSLITNTSSSIFNYGYKAGNLAVNNGGFGVFSYGDTVGTSGVTTNGSYDLFNYGYQAGRLMVADASSYIFNYGDSASQALIAIGSSDIYAYGYQALYQAKLTNSSQIYAYGNNAGASLAGDGYSDIYLFGTAQPTRKTNEFVFGSANDIYTFPGTSGATVAGPVLTTSSTTNTPAQNELVTAKWARETFGGSGAFFYNSTNISGTAFDANTFQYVGSYTVEGSRSYTPAAGAYFGSVITTQRFQQVNGPVMVSTYLTSSGGPASSSYTVHPEIYYTYDTNSATLLGDYEAGNQAIIHGAVTNRYDWVVSFPPIVSTNANGFWIVRRFKVGTKVGTDTLKLSLGTNGVDIATSTPSSISFTQPSAAGANWVAVGSTNSSLPGTAYMDSAKVTNVIDAANLNVGTVTYTNPPAPPSFLTAALPASSTGASAWASDALTPWGTGDLVYYDGSAWKLYSSKITASSSVSDFLINCLKAGYAGSTPKMQARVVSWADTANLLPTDVGLASSGTGSGGIALRYHTPEIPNGYGVKAGTTTTGYSTLFGPMFLAKTGQYYISSSRVALNSGLPDGTDDYWALAGATADGVGSIGTDAVAFYYDPGNYLGYGGTYTNNWQCLTRTGSANTISDTGIAGSANWLTLTVVWSVGSSAVFYVNGTSVATNSVNVPAQNTGLTSFRNLIVKTLGTNNRWMAIDNAYYGIYYAGTRTVFN